MPANDALFGQRANRIGDKAPDFADVHRIDALQADREHRLPQLIVKTTAGKRLSQSGIDQRLVERGGGRADQNMLQYV